MIWLYRLAYQLLYFNPQSMSPTLPRPAKTQIIIVSLPERMVQYPAIRKYMTREKARRASPQIQHHRCVMLWRFGSRACCNDDINASDPLVSGSWQSTEWALVCSLSDAARHLYFETYLCGINELLPWTTMCSAYAGQDVWQIDWCKICARTLDIYVISKWNQWAPSVDHHTNWSMQDLCENSRDLRNIYVESMSSFRGQPCAVHTLNKTFGKLIDARSTREL